MSKKIAVLGTGANGSCTAADLVTHGHDVVLIDQWPAHVEAMRANGLKILIKDEELHVKDLRVHHVCDVCTFTEKFDIVLLMAKAYDTRWMAELIKPHLADDGLLVGVQNSMMTHDIAEIVGAHRTVGCVVELASQLFEPGIVRRSTPSSGTWFALGSLDPSMDARLPEVEEVLKDVGKVSISNDILSAKWMKVVVNAMSMSIKAMAGMNSEQIFVIPGVRELMLRSGEEALAAGQARGHKIEPIIGMKADEAQGSNRFLENMLDKLTRDVGPTAINAMLQDHIRGRKTEIELINGLVASESQRLGLPAPVNEVLTEINGRITSGELKPDASNLELAVEMLKERGVMASVG